MFSPGVSSGSDEEDLKREQGPHQRHDMGDAAAPIGEDPVAAGAAIPLGGDGIHWWGSMLPHAGWIRKRPVNKAEGTTKDRFLVLDGLTLCYYTDHTRRDVKGIVGINCTSSVYALDAVAGGIGGGGGGVGPEVGFVFTEFQHAGLRQPRQLIARVSSKLVLDAWLQRISDAIGFCTRLANTASPEHTPLFDASVIAHCELPARHWKGETGVLLRGNLLWFETVEGGSSGSSGNSTITSRSGGKSGDSSNSSSSSSSRSTRGGGGAAASDSEHQAGGQGGHRRNYSESSDVPSSSGNPTAHEHSSGSVEALGCVSISHTTRVYSVSDTVLGLSSWMLTGSLAPIAQLSERPVLITFQSPAAKQRLAADIANVAKCTRAAMPSPPSGDLCVWACERVGRRACGA